VQLDLPILSKAKIQ